MWLDEIKLGFGHNLLFGNIPDYEGVKTQLQVMAETVPPVDVQSFGLFSSPDYNKFYPGVEKKDLKPLDDDFIYPTFRALSEVIVHKQYNPIDFAENGVLKKSMGLLKGQSVKGDHEGGIHTSMGAVDHVEWQEAYAFNGVKVPAGMNARLKIDAKGNPRIARQLQMDPPGIHSTSVTLSFLWEKSHPSMPEAEFFMKLGSFDKDGKMIRRIATQVKNYREISLVDHGADPFAKMINKDGKIVMPEHANVVYNHDKKTTPKYFIYDFKEGFEDIVYNKENPTIPAESLDIQTSNSENMKEALIALAALIAFKDFDPENAESITKLQEAFKKFKEDKEAAEARATALNTQVTELQAAKPDETLTTGLKEFKQKTLTALRAKATESLQKLYDNKAAQPLVDVIANMDSVEGLEALNQSYVEALDKKYPLSCKKCGSDKVSRGTAHTSNEEGSGETSEESGEPLTKEQLKEKVSKNYGTFRSLHDETPAK